MDDELFEIKYVDGKPKRVKKDPMAEIKSELEIEKPASDFDATKRQLYNDLPQAEIKKDKSITARSLNATLESYNLNRNKYKSQN